MGTQNERAPSWAISTPRAAASAGDATRNRRVASSTGRANYQDMLRVRLRKGAALRATALWRG